MEITEKELEKRLFDAGNKLSSIPSSISELLASLDLVEILLAVVEQSPTESMKEALAPLTKALIAKELLRHSDVDVKVAVASCISEITRITAPDAPYEDDQMKEVFELIVSSFEKLDDKLSRSYTKRISILQTVAKIRSCVVMLDLECDDLVVEMFQLFFRTIRDDHHDIVFSSMETIMTLVVDESEDIPLNLLSSILNVLKKDVQKVRPIAYQLGEKVFVNCASKLKDYLLPAIRSAGASLNDYSKAVTDAYQSKDEAFEPIGGDAPNKSVVDENNSLNAPSEKADDNNLVDAPSEKAVEVATKTPEDTPPFEEVGPSHSESPKTIMNDGTLQKDNDNTVSENDNSKEADLDTQGEKVESSETVDESVGSEEPPKCKPEHNTVAANNNSKEADLDTQGEKVESSETVDDSVGTEEPPKCKPEHSTVAANDDSKVTDLDMQGIKVGSSETIDDSVGTEEPPTCKSEQEKLSRQNKTIMTNGTLQNDNDNAVAVDDNSKETDLDTQGEKVEPSETIVDTVGTEETPKCKPEQENSSRQEGEKPNSTKSSSEPLNLAAPDKKGEDTDKPEHQDDAILVDNIGCEDPVINTAEAGDDETLSGAPIPSPKTPDNEFAGITSACPSVSLADEPCSKKTEQGEKREDRIQESEIVSDVDSEKESDTKSECDTQVEKEGTGSESNMNSSSEETASPVSDLAESAPDSAGDTKSEDDNKDEADGNLAQDLAQEEEIEVGDSQLAVKKKMGQTKPTPAKSSKKKSAKEEKKPKTVSVPKSTPKVTKYDSDMEESLKSRLKRKRTSGAKESKTKVYDAGLVGATVKVWWPDDKKFYQGIVDSFDSTKKKHTIVYEDGDVEILNLKEEKWQLIHLSEGRANIDDASDEFADEMPKSKNAKTITDLQAKQVKSSSSAKKSGVSSSRSKATSKSGTKHDIAKIADKPKEESSKKGGKSDLNKSRKSTKVSTSGGKLMGDTPKSAAKSKDDKINTPKGSTKSKSDMSKGASKSKGKTPESVGKSSAGGSGKLKVATPTNQDDSEDELLEPETTPEKPKGKPQSASKFQKSSKKRKRSAKGW